MKLLSVFVPVALAALALGTPNPKPSAKPPPPPPPKKCGEELFCCLSTTASDVLSTKSLLGLLGVHLTSAEAKLEIGLTCSPILLKRDDSTLEWWALRAFFHGAGVYDANRYLAFFSIFKTVCCEKEFGE